MNPLRWYENYYPVEIELSKYVSHDNRILNWPTKIIKNPYEIRYIYTDINDFVYFTCKYNNNTYVIIFDNLNNYIGQIPLVIDDDIIFDQSELITIDNKGNIYQLNIKEDSSTLIKWEKKDV